MNNFRSENDATFVASREKLVPMTLGAIKGRHPLPVDDYVFDEDIKDIRDLNFMGDKVHEKLRHCSALTLYVTGLTVVTTEICSYCSYNNIPLTLLHFDRETGEYFPQVVISGYMAEKNRNALRFYEEY